MSTINMELKEIINLFNNGALERCWVSEFQMMDDPFFIINFQTVRKQVLGIRTQRDKEFPKKFMTIETAISTAKKIGFKQITIDI